MPRARTPVIALGAAVAGAAAVGAAAVAVHLTRHGRGVAGGHEAPGGILMNDAAGYDRRARVFMRSFYGGIAADVAAAAPPAGRVLEVGCGPGHLSVALAAEHGLDVTGLDLDPAMIERARANGEQARAERARADAEPGASIAPSVPSFVLGDVSDLPFPDASFDVVLSTLSLHHWTDPTAGLREIGRVLRPGGRALVWDLRPGIVPLHRHVPDAAAHAAGAGLDVVSASPWRWPWRFSVAQRVELAPGPRPLAEGATQAG